MKKLLVFLSILFLTGNLYAATVSFDQLAASSDLTHTKYNADLDKIYQDHNSNVQSSNIAADTVAESDMADDANPRLRTFEGAACEKVYEGLLSSTTSGTLVGSIPAGTAYPLGYRVVKASATPKTFTASKWTFVDIDINGNFQYSEVAIGAATPSVATNSIRISRVSSDGTQVPHVQDLRTTNCAAGPFEIIKDTSTGASLEDILSWGTPVRNRGSVGFVQGLHVSWDAHATFTVKQGSAFINGQYRFLSSDITVAQTADDPSNGTSGIDTGAIAASTRYNIFALADQSGVSSYSISFGTGSTPNGGTNYRKIGTIATDASTLFMSADVSTTHGFSLREAIGGWANFNGKASAGHIRNSYNVAAFTDGGTGIFTLTWDRDFVSNYGCVVSAADTSGLVGGIEKDLTYTSPSFQFTNTGPADSTAADRDIEIVLCMGETQP